MSLRYPLDNYTITQGFGADPTYYRQFGQNGHNGIDLGAPLGTPVYAADDGTVAFEGWGQNHSWMGSIAGISIIIAHASIHTAYAHLYRTVVNKGQRVSKGDLIGFVGQSGTATGPHTHFEVLPASPNFANGFAGRVNPAPYMGVTNGATVDQIKQAYREILEREADQDGINHYQAYTIDFVRQDLANSGEKRTLDAMKAEAARVAAEQAAAEAARQAEEARRQQDEAKKAAECKAAEEAAAKAAEEARRAEEERLKAEAELARIAEEERKAREEAEARAKAQQLIAKTATPSGEPMTTADLQKLGSEDEHTTTTRSEALKSASLFVARIYTQYLVGQLVAEGLAGIVADAIGWVASATLIGYVALGITALLVFWGQFGYKLSQDSGWKWAANLKWPF